MLLILLLTPNLPVSQLQSQKLMPSHFSSRIEYLTPICIIGAVPSHMSKLTQISSFLGGFETITRVYRRFRFMGHPVGLLVVFDRHNSMFTTAICNFYAVPRIISRPFSAHH